ncbi:hypothetical protein GDO81_008472 [Engystomops pustulosus]|uniref:N-terminal Ras-GEF domain-containing protein n=1 Tax=Engystomops pustulosus TaxID=76066 RepID=A0AAV7CGM5_ENGPU|nr:hypothetical protein GDO81_008472 [Engystomops pustulosus]
MGSSTFRKAASLDELLYTCIEMFDEKGDLNDNNLLPRMVLLMHRWYLSSTELAGKLLSIYPLFTARKTAIISYVQYGITSLTAKVMIWFRRA